VIRAVREVIFRSPLRQRSVGPSLSLPSVPCQSFVSLLSVLRQRFIQIHQDGGDCRPGRDFRWIELGVGGRFARSQNTLGRFAIRRVPRPMRRETLGEHLKLGGTRPSAGREPEGVLEAVRVGRLAEDPFSHHPGRFDECVFVEQRQRL